MTKGLFEDQNALVNLCRKHGIVRLSLFGSHLKGNATAESDVDLLVQFASGGEPGFLRLAEIEADLSKLLGGRRVDLRTAEDLSRHFRSEILRTAQIQYAI